MTDKEIAREITLDEILSYFKERVKDFFATYKNESGGEDRIEICLIREGYRTLLRAEEKLKRQQAEIEQLRQLFVESGKEQDRLMAEVERLKGDKESLYVIGYNLGKNEAIHEFAERLKEYSQPIGLIIPESTYDVVVSTAIINEVEREMMGKYQVDGKA